jgi:hypothetical protein
LFQEKYGNLSATGLGEETVYGTPAPPTTFLPMSENTIETDPGLFFPQVMVGSRDLNVFPLYGQEKDLGAIAGPIFPDNASMLLAAAIGADAQRYGGVTGNPTGVTTTLSAGVSAGATTANVTSPTGIVQNQSIVQVDVNVNGASTSECRLVTNVGGSTITFNAPLTYGHLSGAVVTVVNAPFVHTITYKSQLPGITVEKNLGGFQSIQFAGGRLNKLGIKGQATDTEATMTADFIAQSLSILDTPSAINIIDEQPFVFAEFTLTWEGGVISQAGSFDLNIDNGVKPYYTFNGTHMAQFIPPLHLMVDGSFDAVFDTLDAQYDWFTQIRNGTEAELTFLLAHPEPGYSIEFLMPNVRLAKEQIPPKVSEVVMETIDFKARRSMSANPSETIRCILTNDQFMPVG